MYLADSITINRLGPTQHNVNFFLSTAFATSYKFWYVVFPFLFVSRFFKISFFISSLTYWLFRSVLSSFPYL